jgi:hypothetical protein
VDVYELEVHGEHDVFLKLVELTQVDYKRLKRTLDTALDAKVITDWVIEPATHEIYETGYEGTLDAVEEQLGVNLGERLP